jgi:hypothetical protein
MTTLTRTRERGTWYHRGRLAVLGLALLYTLLALPAFGNSWYQLGTAALLAVVSTRLAGAWRAGLHRQVFGAGRAGDVAGLVLGPALAGVGHNRDDVPARRWRTEVWLLAAHAAAYLNLLLVVLSPVKAVLFVAIHQGLYRWALGWRRDGAQYR